MKLIYANIIRYRNIFDQEIYFSNQYRISYDRKKGFPEGLLIRKINPDSIASIVYENSMLNNVHVIVGKTGAGKTNIFQMLGMPEEERTMKPEKNASYFLIYESSDFFVIEPYDIKIDTSVNPHFGSQEENRKRSEELERMPDYIREHMRIYNSMNMYQFTVKDCHVTEVYPVVRANGLGEDITFIFNGYERHAFPCCPYEETRFESMDSNTIWNPRINAEYHKTTLWNSCRFLKEYIESFDKENIKQRAALVIKCQNWSETIKQHIDEQLKAHDYWTFIDRIKEDEINVLRGKMQSSKRRPAIRYQFVHDLWTDFALYLRKYISYILMYPNEVDEGYEDFSSTKDVFQEARDYWYEKQLEEQRGGNKRSQKNPIDPKVLPDFEDISILKRIEWLSMWIDRRGEGTPYHLLWQIYGDIKDIGEILCKFDDRYFTNDTFTLPIEDMYTQKNKRLVEDLFERIEQYRPDDTGIFSKELLPYRLSCISSGEHQFAKVLGGIEEICVKLSVGQFGNHPNIIYLLDEPETYMHPELCRTFIKRLDTVLKERTGNADIQVLISTHSPLFLSDFLPEQITRLDLDSKGYCKIKNETEKAYFGANIHTILADSFFLDYTIGEYSREYLQEQINWLNTVLGKKNLTYRERQRKEQLSRIVPYIGDTIIRRSFEMLIRQVGEEND